MVNLIDPLIPYHNMFQKSNKNPPPQISLVTRDSSPY